MPSRAKHYRAVALVFVAAVMWSTGGLFIKSIDWNPLAIAGGRSLVAALFMLVVVGKPRLTRSRALWIGAVAYAATVIGFVLANKLTTSANAILLQFSAPIYVALLGAWLLGERVTRRDWIAIFLSLGGMALFFLDRLSTGSLLGNIIAIISGVTLAALVVALRIQKDSRPEYTILLGNALTALIGLPFMLQGAPGDLGWGGIAVMGVFQLALPYLFFSPRHPFAECPRIDPRPDGRTAVEPNLGLPVRPRNPWSLGADRRGGRLGDDHAPARGRSPVATAAAAGAARNTAGTVLIRVHLPLSG